MARRDRRAVTTGKSGTRAERVVEYAEAVWDDRVARWCGLAGLASLWLAGALVEPVLLVLPAAAVLVLCYRLRHKPEEPADDWF